MIILETKSEKHTQKYELKREIWNHTYIVLGLYDINRTFYGSNHCGTIDTLKSGFIFVGLILNVTLVFMPRIWRLCIKLWCSRTKNFIFAVRLILPLFSLGSGLLSGGWCTNLSNWTFTVHHHLTSIAQGSTTRSLSCLRLL